MGIKIYFNNKLIVNSLIEYKYNHKELKFVEKNSEILASPQNIIELFNDFDIIYINDLDSSELIMQLNKIFKPINADGGVVRNKQDEILMIFRNGYWDLPKGKRENGENSEECAKREVEEECGINVDSVENKICNTYHIYQMFGEWIIKETSWYNMVASDGSSLKPQREEGITDIKWVDYSSLKTYLTKSYATIVDVITHISNKTI